MVHLVAAIGFGAQEVRADALAEGLEALGMFGLTVEDWAQALGAVERGEVPPVGWGPVQQEADLVERVKRASDEELVRARTVLVGLRGFYGLHALHGLLLPDTPALAALRQPIDDWGMFPFLSQLIAFSPSPGQFAEALTVCLEPLLDALYETLTEQLAAGPTIFRIPGDETGTGIVGFGESWLRTLREQSGGNESGEASVPWMGETPE